MDLYELPFVKLINLGDDILEVIVNEGVDYTLEMVEEYHQWIRDHMATPCYILVNKLNSYSYTFEVQQRLGAIPEIRAIALVAYNRSGHLALEAMQEIPKVLPWNSKLFHDREMALLWLREQQAQDAQTDS